MGHEFQRKMLQYFKNQVTGKAFSILSVISPEIPTRMTLGGNVIQPFALHIKKNFIFEKRKSTPTPKNLLMHVEKREVWRDWGTGKTYHTRNLLWKAKTSPSPNTATSLKAPQVQT